MASIRSSAGLLAGSLVYFASLSHALPALGDFKYQGCYTDNPDHQSLTGKMTYDSEMTLSKCSLACSGYQWFGVESGSQCYCGTSLSTTAEKRPDTECSMKCGGSHCQLCGEVDRINVFWTGRNTTESTTVPETTITSETASTSESATTTESATSTEESTTTSETTTSESISTAESTTSTESTTASESTTSETTINETTTAEPTTTSEDSTTIEPATPTPTSTACELATTLLPTPAVCWASMPTACATLNRTPTIPWPANTPYATQCRGGFLAQATYPAQIVSCFTDIGKSTFKAVSAYSCVANADVYCATATVCKDAAGLSAPGAPTPTNVLGEGGFEDGVTWTPSSSTLGGDDAIVVGLAGDVVHSGRFALKAVFTNVNGGSRGYTRQVSLDPGATYAVSWWWWSSNAQASTVTRMQFVGAGSSSFLKDVATLGGPTGQWVKVEQQFTAGGSFGTVNFSMFGNKAAAANTFYVDDISIIRVA